MRLPRFHVCIVAIAASAVWLAAPKLAAQTPAEPVVAATVIKRTTMRQTSATTVIEEGSLLSIYAGVGGITPTPQAIAFSGNGVSLQIFREPTFDFRYQRNFATRAELDQFLPDGTYMASVVGVTARVVVATNARLLAGRVTNFEALQRWNGNPPLAVEVAPLASDMLNASVGFSLLHGGGEFGGDTGQFTSGPQTLAITSFRIPASAPGEVLTGRLVFRDVHPVTRELAHEFILYFPITRAHLPPTIVRSPEAQTVVAGTSATFSVTATGSALGYAWRKDSVPILGATQATLTIPAARAADAGVYSVVVSNTGGVVLSGEARLTVLAPTSPPVVATAPAGRTVLAGESHTLSVTVTGTPPFAYQWFQGSAPILGATAATLGFEQVRLSDAGEYTVRITNAVGTVTTLPAVLAVTPVTRISNLSIRSRVGGSAGTLAVGLTVGRAVTGAAKPLLLRAAGPALQVFGVDDALEDPQLTVLANALVVAHNNDWGATRRSRRRASRSVHFGCRATDPGMQRWSMLRDPVATPCRSRAVRPRAEWR